MREVIAHIMFYLAGSAVTAWLFWTGEKNEEAVTGNWTIEKLYPFVQYKCSECGRPCVVPYAYCPHCGKPMDTLPKEEEDHDM